MATLKEQIKADLTVAMKERAEMVTSTLRMALAAIINAEVAGKEAVALSDDQVIDVIRSEAKKRAEAAEIYEQAGRNEAAIKERAEAGILHKYLPAAMDDSVLAGIVAEEVAATNTQGITGPKAMGVVVKAVRERVGSSADGSRIAAAVKAALG